jgi:ADP-heptose:LPS heptosyltransferase
MEVDWLCGSGEFAPVLEGVPWVKRFFGRQQLPDNAADVYNYLLSVDNAEFMDTKSINNHRVDVFAWRCPELKDKIIEDKHLEYYVSEEEKQWFKTLNIKNPFVTMTTQTTCFNRVLDDSQNKEICKKILDNGISVVILDKNRNDIYDSRAINMQGKLSIRQSAAIVYHADAVLTPDTGLLHIASAMDKKTLAYFGAMDPKYRLTSKNTITITYPIKCWPCHNYSCHNGNPECVKKINLDEIVKLMVGLVVGK